ncbi:hypothetical protein [Candidatus Ichthyocystis sparus]|uniref:hypothetical protein n=1 Tax=Candidatus Ichthyocystis sparus TaxID=1561004 RepID=UPI0011463174|nr:hypothetical protein [Candidatus Ichthyocystis sparus]
MFEGLRIMLPRSYIQKNQEKGACAAAEQDEETASNTDAIEHNNDVTGAETSKIVDLLLELGEAYPRTQCDSAEPLTTAAAERYDCLSSCAHSLQQSHTSASSVPTEERDCSGSTNGHDYSTIDVNEPSETKEMLELLCARDLAQQPHTSTSNITTDECDCSNVDVTNTIQIQDLMGLLYEDSSITQKPGNTSLSITSEEEMGCSNLSRVCTQQPPTSAPSSLNTEMYGCNVNNKGRTASTAVPKLSCVDNDIAQQQNNTPSPVTAGKELGKGNNSEKKSRKKDASHVGEAKRAKLGDEKTDEIGMLCSRKNHSEYNKKNLQEKDTSAYDAVLKYINPCPISINTMFNSMIKDQCMMPVNVYVFETRRIVSFSRKANVEENSRSKLRESLSKMETALDRKVDCLLKLDTLLRDFKLTEDVEMSELSRTIFSSAVVEETRIGLEEEIECRATEIKFALELISGVDSVAEKTFDSIMSIMSKSKDDLIKSLITNSSCESIITSSLSRKKMPKIPTPIFNRIMSFRDSIYYELEHVERDCIKSISMIPRIYGICCTRKLSPEIYIKLDERLKLFSEFICNELKENTPVIGDEGNVYHINRQQISEFAVDFLNGTKSDYLHRIIAKRTIMQGNREYTNRGMHFYIMRTLDAPIGNISKLILDLCKKAHPQEGPKTYKNFEIHTYEGIFALVLEKLKSEVYINDIESKIIGAKLESGNTIDNYSNSIFTSEVISKIKELSTITLEEVKRSLPSKIGTVGSMILPCSDETKDMLEGYIATYNDEVRSLELTSGFFSTYVEHSLFSDSVSKKLKLPRKHFHRVREIQIKLFDSARSLSETVLYNNRYSILRKYFECHEGAYSNISASELVRSVPDLPDVIRQTIADCVVVLNKEGTICNLSDSLRETLILDLIEEMVDEFNLYINQEAKVVKKMSKNTTN